MEWSNSASKITHKFRSATGRPKHGVFRGILPLLQLPSETTQLRHGKVGQGLSFVGAWKLHRKNMGIRQTQWDLNRKNGDWTRFDP